MDKQITSKQNIDENDFQTGEISDLIGNPSKIQIFLSVLMTCTIFVGAIIGGFFINVPQSITTDIEISNSEPVVAVMTNSSGFVEKILKKDGDKLKQGEVIAIIHSGTDFRHVRRLKLIMNQYEKGSIDYLTFRRTIISSDFQLGEF